MRRKEGNSVSISPSFSLSRLLERERKGSTCLLEQDQWAETSPRQWEIWAAYLLSVRKTEPVSVPQEDTLTFGELVIVVF